MTETGDPLNIGVKLFEDEVVIVYRPYDEYTEIGEFIVCQWEKYLHIRGVVKGQLGNSDELVMIIAEELRRRNNVITKESISEKNRSK